MTFSRHRLRWSCSSRLSPRRPRREPPGRDGETWTVPRAADDHADLSGVWANNSVTPLERPQQWAGKDRLTDAELEQLKRDISQVYDEKVVMQSSKDCHRPDQSRRCRFSFPGMSGPLDIPPNSITQNEGFMVLKQAAQLENFQPHMHRFPRLPAQHRRFVWKKGWPSAGRQRRRPPRVRPAIMCCTSPSTTIRAGRRQFPVLLDVRQPESRRHSALTVRSYDVVFGTNARKRFGFSMMIL